MPGAPEGKKNVWDKNWDTFFARTQQLPPPERTRDFLVRLPHNGRVLDFGCGSGRWAAAFLRDRPDLTVDAVDQFIDKASLLPPDLRGEKIQADFNDFRPTHRYDGIWAYATLFFIPHALQAAPFGRLVDALTEDGVIELTMVEDGESASAAGFYGMSEDVLKECLAEAGLNILLMEKLKDAQYGPSRITIPTFYVRAQKAANADRTNLATA